MLRTLQAAFWILRRKGWRALLREARRSLEHRWFGATEIRFSVATPEVLAADWTDRGAAKPPPRGGHGPLTVNWVVPPAGMSSGGHDGIFRFVNHLARSGHRSRLYFHDPLGQISFADQLEILRKGYPRVDAEIMPHTSAMQPCDALVATSWQTAYPVFNSSLPVRKFYLVQDFEPSFYPAGSEAALAANTYRFGLHGITAGRWLANKLTQEFGMTCEHFEFGFNASEYANAGLRHRKGVLFYARPVTPRRGFELGVLALELFHRQRPEFQIHMFGWDISDYKLPFPFASHGSLSHEHLNQLLNRCAAGLVVSLTNLSYLPLEMLGAGCIPVINDGPNNRLVCDNPFIQYTEPSPHALAAGLTAVVTRPDLAAYADTASKSVSSLAWDAAAARVEAILLREVVGGGG